MWTQIGFFQMLQGIIFVILGLLSGLCMIMVAFIIPAIFNYKLIPRIEKRLGAKLEYSLNFYNSFPFSKWLRCIEISQYIISRHMGWKFFARNPHMALNKANYKIEEARSDEIKWSVIFMLAFLGFLILGGIAVLFHPKWLH